VLVLFFIDEKNIVNRKMNRFLFDMIDCIAATSIAVGFKGA